MTSPTFDPRADLVQLPLQHRINIKEDIKGFLASAIKELARHEIQNALRIKGYDKVRIDNADNLQCHILITTENGPRMFTIQVKEVG